VVCHLDNAGEELDVVMTACAASRERVFAEIDPNNEVQSDWAAISNRELTEVISYLEDPETYDNSVHGYEASQARFLECVAKAIRDDDDFKARRRINGRSAAKNCDTEFDAFGKDGKTRADRRNGKANALVWRDWISNPIDIGSRRLDDDKSLIDTMPRRVDLGPVPQ
jgi:hypothetical protein